MPGSGGGGGDSADDVQITHVIDSNGQTLPLHGTSLGGALGPPVKQERADDAEIRELAAKMKEQQKQQAAQQANRQAAAILSANGSGNTGSGGGGTGGGPGSMQPPLTNGNGQANIMSYLSRYQKLPNGTMQVVPALSNASNGRTNGALANNNNSSGGGGSGGGGEGNGTDKKTTGPCDEESIKGHFGWAQFGKVCIPYIYRQSEKYCSVRMIELKLLGKYLNCLHSDIYSSCTCVRSYYITDAEARLFIEINHKHCDGDFGRDIFTQKDLVVRLSDASKFYQFLDICYRKLMSGSKTPSEKCGFIRINKESVVPYTLKNNQKVVPLFYFEGETENLKTKAELLNGWDLAYLKFCCKVQGIRNELFSSENVAVISLMDIQSYFPNGTEFEDYWPSKVVDSNLLIGNRNNVNNSVNWTRQPSAPPPKVSGLGSSSGTGNASNAQKNQQQHNTAAVCAAAAAAQQQHLIKQRAAAANAAAAAANGGAGNANAAYTTQQAQAAAAVAAYSSAAMLQNQGRPGMLAAAAQQTVQALANSGWMSGQNNLPQLHAQMLAQQTHANNRVQYRAHMDNMMLSGSSRQPYSYSNPSISMSSVNIHSGQGNAPPPLVRSAAGQNANHMSPLQAASYLQQQQAAAAAQQHQQAAAVVAQHQRMAAAAAAHHAQQNGRGSGGGASGGGGGGGGGSGNSASAANAANSASIHLQRHAFHASNAGGGGGDSAQRLCVIPEIPINNMNIDPYKVQKVCVEKHLVPCINMKAYNHSEQLMTLTEFQKNFFPSVPLDHCKRLIEALGVELYKANRRQVQILMEYDRSYNENMPLVQVRDIIKYHPQLTFMTRHPEQPPAKRTRTS